ncbi:putative quinol monooxygenase [Nonomuraea sp. NPDC051191]|uniref:putative quinol monooxygenase n=1 Tax=Nonomuraea sp. NPDC051191 TaxID=3364372 RepID=UPI00379D1EB1
MEILVAVIALAGALLAAVATGALIRRLRDEPEGWLIAWTVAAGALCLSLAVVAIGSVLGFGPVTFRIYQVTGSLLAPLWLAVGLIQLMADKVPPRFLAWLFGIALTVVSVAILTFDPLRSTDLGKKLPSGSALWGLIPDKLLIGVHAIDVLVLLACVVVAALKWRGGDEYDTDNLHAVLVIAPSSIALVGAMRFAVPPLFTTALLAVGSAAIWYTVLRPLAPYEDDDEDELEAPHDDREHRPGRRAAPEPVPAAEPPPVAPPRRSPGLGDLVAEYRAGDQQVDYAARMGAAPDTGPATGYIMNGSPPPRMDTSPRLEPPPQRPDYSMPGTGVAYPGAELFSPSQPQPQQGGGRPAPSIYGLLTVFTIMDGAGAAFDRLAEATVEAVRRSEPDTLVYACHAVKSAPLQRIVYELYRDEVAYRDHQRQPHVERFLNERQAMVLATNVIELNVNAAKVVPLPTVMF